MAPTLPILPCLSTWIGNISRQTLDIEERKENARNWLETAVQGRSMRRLEGVLENDGVAEKQLADPPKFEAVVM